MRLPAFLSAVAVAVPAFAQFGQFTVTQVGDVKITQFDFNSPAITPGQFSSGNDVGLFNPGAFPNAYFSEPIPDGGPQLAYIQATADPPVIQIASGTFDSNVHLFTVYVAASLQFPGAGYDLFADADTGPQGPHKIAEVIDAAPIGTFRPISISVGSVPPGTIGTYNIYLTTKGPGGGVLPDLTFFDDAELVEGPPGQVPEPSSSVIACLAGIALARRRRSRS